MVNSKRIPALANRRLLGALLVLICAVVLWGCNSSDSDAVTVGPDGARLLNAELMFITRGSLEGEIGPNG